jgi:hypothetical protein
MGTVEHPTQPTQPTHFMELTPAIVNFLNEVGIPLFVLVIVVVLVVLLIATEDDLPNDKI